MVRVLYEGRGADMKDIAATREGIDKYFFRMVIKEKLIKKAIEWDLLPCSIKCRRLQMGGFKNP